MSKFNKELNLAIKLVKIATEITEWFRKEGFYSFQKDDKTPVTIADYASQLFIIDKLKLHFPNDQIIAEETLNSPIKSHVHKIIEKCYNSLGLKIIENLESTINYRGISSLRQWTVDPIDGTQGFQNNLSYAIGIGLMIDSKMKIASIGIPSYNEKGKAIFIAEKGQGAQKAYENNNFYKISVSNNSNLENARMCRSLHYDKPWVGDFGRLAKIKNFIKMDSMAKFCMISDGTADLYIKPLDLKRSFSWDFLPGTLMVKEAGGTITDLKGQSIKFKNEKCIVSSPGLIATNGTLHQEIIKYLDQIDYH